MADDSTLAYLLARASDARHFERWLDQGRSTGWCSCPVRLAGSTRTADRATGEVLTMFTTHAEPDGVLLKACGQRRATACPACSETYRSDAWHLIAAGLRGGKDVPPDLTSHPMLFLTLTAPSFGSVHSRREREGRPRRCRPASGDCEHGRSRACSRLHHVTDDELGQPICADCFDYERAVLWNALASELWRRTTITVQRQLARSASISAKAFRSIARLSYSRVVEYQRRGVVHVHAVVRMDGPDGPSDSPPSDIGVEELERAVVLAAGAARVPYPATNGITGEARWGTQVDVRRINESAAPPEAVAAYIAKYSTKSTDAVGRLDHRLRESDLTSLDLPPHLGRLVRTAWRLGGRPELADLRLRPWAHTLGFRGHWLTKSRRYSTTLGELRRARADWARRKDAAQRDAVVVKDWRYAGRGWANPGDELLAHTAARERRESHFAAREARRSQSTPDEN